MNFLTICDALLLSFHEFQFEKEFSFSIFTSSFSTFGNAGFGLSRNVEKKSSFTVWTLFVTILLAKEFYKERNNLIDFLYINKINFLPMGCCSEPGAPSLISRTLSK